MKMVLIGTILLGIGMIILTQLHSTAGSMPFTVPGGFLIGFGLRRAYIARKP